MPLNSIKRRELLRRFEAGDISLTQFFKMADDTKEMDLDRHDSSKLSEEGIEEILKDLDSMIGLKKIKELVTQLRAFVMVQRERDRQNLKVDSLVLHMIFKGNPGTGKTTVARILAKFFKELGVLEDGGFKEVDRGDLVGEYIGHTAQKTKKVIKEALGGILFIDEAYSLARGGHRDFGKEAIDTMVKAMEDKRDNLVIILAGYPKEMETFLSSNPGLRSRFPIQVDFEDYSLEELIEIAKMMIAEREYKLTKGGEAKLYNILSTIRKGVGPEEGNARTVRNIIEEGIRNQALRLMKKDKVTKEDLMAITREDLSLILNS
ncbi:AAA family ATPase [Halonatronum saccharophilum]|uniref:AAA family ATPase n=1 Tax=Halonatronum saccharophilum TaxID=150060 RepID=UPI000484027E|nr:AAA family ATPase [Halonatronum saccharophilum]